MPDKLTYGDGLKQQESKLLSGDAQKGLQPLTLKEDIAQSRYFTVTLEEVQFNGTPIQFKLAKPSEGEDTGKHEVHVFEPFFPLKNISVTFTSYDNMHIPFAIFGDLPILHRKRLSRINISAYDLDDDRVEYALQEWENRCFPKSSYVAYLADVMSKFEYISYDVTGRVSYTKILYVIPADTIQVSRGYDDNSEKIVSFSLVAIGEPGASDKGISKSNIKRYNSSDDRIIGSNNPPILETNFLNRINNANTLTDEIVVAPFDKQ